MNILVVGGAGYIGSHMVKLLHLKGHEVTTLDSLVTGYRDAVVYGEFIQGDLADRYMLDNIFIQKKYDAVLHFASYIQVGESVQHPSEYYRNNVTNTQNLLDAIIKNSINNFIFSSTAAIYGEPEYTPIDERHPKKPINPYGHSKQMVEQMLSDYENAYGLSYVSLRYFNAAGADPEGEIGERHEPETHLLPLILQVASGRRELISVYGRDYSTHDGTCIRDYIHVMDLCDAHLKAVQYLISGGNSGAFNLGNGNGFSVQQIIDTAIKVTGKPIRVACGPRRDGDPAILVADSTKAKQFFGWQPYYTDLEKIIEHAWKWELNYSR